VAVSREGIDQPAPVPHRYTAVQAANGGNGATGAATDVVDLPLDPTKAVESIEIRSVVSESVFAIFGITLVKAER